jgi:hypothetical protein
MRKQRIPQIKMPSMPANEKQMWKDYAQARKAESPGCGESLARKYKVKLLSRNRVALSRTYGGASAPAPQAGTAAAAAGCGDICHISKFERWEKVGKSKMVISCSLDTCKYVKELKSWVCYYSCIAGIRLK